MDVVEFEKELILIIDPPTDEGEEKIGNFQQVFDIVKSPEGFSWIVSNFDEIKSNSAKLYVMSLIRMWCKEKFDQILQSSVSDLKKLLFNSAIRNLFCESEEYQFSVINAQIFYALNAYPDNWGTFWEDLFEMEFNYILCFLINFFMECSIISPFKMRILSSIKPRMIEDNVVYRILQIAFDGINTKNPLSFSILSYLCKWTDGQWMNDPDWFNKLVSGMSSNACTPYVFKVFSSIIMHDNDESRISSILGIVSPQRIIDVCHSSGDLLIQTSGAQLAYSIGLRILNSEISSSYYALALEFLQYTEQVSTIIVPFISSYTKQFPEMINHTFSAAFNRLVLFFSENYQNRFPVPSSKAFLEQLCFLFVTCMQIDRSSFTSLFDSSIENFDINSNPYYSTAILYLFIHIIENTTGFDSMSEYIHVFMSVLEVDSPIPIQSFFSVFLFYKLLSRKPECFPVESLQILFDSFIQYLINEEFDENSLKGILVYLNTLVNNKSIHIQPTEDIITMCIESMNYNLVSVASSLLRFVDDPIRSGIIVDYCSFFASQASNDQDFFNGCQCALSFVSNMGYSMSTEAILAVRSLIEAFADYVNSNDELLSLYIKACMVNMKVEGYPCVLAIMSYLSEPPSIISFCSFILMVIKAPDNPLKEQIQNIMINLTDTVLGIMDEVYYGLWIPNNEREYQKMITIFFNLASLTIKDTDPELIARMINILQHLIDTQYDSEIIVDVCLNYLVNLPESFHQDISKRFVSSAFNCLMSPTFDPNIDSWGKVINRIHQFIHCMTINHHEIVYSCIVQVVDQYGGGIDLVNLYYECNDVDARVKHEILRQFFQELMKLKKNFGI